MIWITRLANLGTVFRKLLGDMSTQERKPYRAKIAQIRSGIATLDNRVVTPLPQGLDGYKEGTEVMVYQGTYNPILVKI